MTEPPKCQCDSRGIRADRPPRRPHARMSRITHVPGEAQLDRNMCALD